MLFLEDDQPLDWTLRHGRSSGLTVALKEAPDIIYTDTYKDKITKTLISLLSSDRVIIIIILFIYCFFFVYLLLIFLCLLSGSNSHEWSTGLWIPF